MFEMFNKKGVPYVADKGLQYEIDKWLRANGLKKGSFGVILQKLGFEPRKKIYLSRCSGEVGEVYLFYGYGSYDNNVNNIIVLSGFGKIELNKLDSKMSYECTFDKNTYGKVDVKQIGDQYSKKENGISYFRNIIKLNDGDEIYIKVEDKVLEQGISINIKLKNYWDSYFRVSNEKVLQDYLKELKYPISIEKVYSDICFILSDSINRYKNITLTNYNPSEFYANREAKSYLKYSVDDFGERIDVVSDDKNVSYKRRFFNNKVDIDVNYDDYKIYFEVDFDDFEYSTRRLENEKELQRYLMNLTFPISIEKVYKDICEISLGDVSKYSRIVLQCCDNKKNGMVSDLIVLENGNLEKFGMTKNDKTMFIDKYGNFSYRISDLETDFSVNISGDDKNKCEMFAKSSKYMDDYIDSLIVYDISDARKEKEETKKLVKKIFYSNENGSN